MIRKLIIFFLLCCSCACQLRGNHCYSEYWQKFFWEMWKNDAFALGTYIKIDTGNHWENIRSFQLNEQLRWKAFENVSFELHYAYIHGRAVVPKSPWRWQHRLELEANPQFKLSCNYLIKTRNRLEIRKVQTEPTFVYRLRQRTMLVISFKEKGMLKAFSIYNELFYNISTHLFTQNRLCPFQLTFALSDNVDMDLYFLMRFFTYNNVWQRSAVFGTQFSF